jgi:hypothetical protein
LIRAKSPFCSLPFLRSTLISLLCALGMAHAFAQSSPPASVPYTPSWQARHHLQLLVDQVGLQITTTHWPLPAAAIEQSLSAMRPQSAQQTASQTFVLNELRTLMSRGQARIQLRSATEGLPGFGENYTPGSSAQLVSPAVTWGSADSTLTLAGRVGAKIEETANSLSGATHGLGTEGQGQLRLEDSALVVGLNGFNIQAFAHRNWWGPGWQSSMVSGSNNPAWQGAGLQRGGVMPSQSPWLAWMGPWNLDLYVAKAQDPLVAINQPQGFVYSGARLTLHPQPWLEVGLSRALQMGGAGRPSDFKTFAKAFFGQNVNKETTDTFVDSSNQLAGYDARISCPASVKRDWQCAVYGQWMGEDSAGKPIPLPSRFMSLWGMDTTYAQGRYRAYAEYVNANINSMPWDGAGNGGGGFINGVYTQGYTQGGRWVGTAVGSGSKVLTLGWMDAQSGLQLKLHTGTVLTSIGAYDPLHTPNNSAPHGNLLGLSASRVMHWKGVTLTPEASWMHLTEGQDTGANLKTNLRLGVSMQVPLWLH